MMYTVPNLLGGTKVRVVTDRNGGRTRTEEAGGNMHVVLFDIPTDYNVAELQSVCLAIQTETEAK